MTKMMLVAMMMGLAASPASALETTPMARTVKLIEDLEKKVKEDGKDEQESFDEYSCWCEKTLQRKAADISAAKVLITETEMKIKKLKAEIASHAAEIAQLEKDIAQNIAAQKEATELRTKQNKDYSEERSESEQCIGALEAAIKVLTGAGAKKKSGFLETFHEAQLLSVVSGIKIAMNRNAVAKAVSESDLEVMRHFVSKPDDFLGHHAGAMIATQVGQNPFGDYAPQSTQIQGILKGMYDAFTADLEKDNVAEASAQKSFEELMATKRKEQATLEATLQKQESDKASKTKDLSESEILLDDTVAQLEADEKFFEDTKKACAAKATEWAVRTRLRTEELNGMQTAIKILSSEEAQKVFENATTTFTQLAAVYSHTQTENRKGQTQAYTVLKKVAAEVKSMSVARIAMAVRSGGHFDKVIVMIDSMIALLRKEEQEDIEHRDRCENNQNANKNELEDLTTEIDKTGNSIKRMKGEKKTLDQEITETDNAIKATKKDMDELLSMRNAEEAEFIQALKDDADAIVLLKKAIVALSKFYKRNKIAAPEFVQRAPEYSKDEDKAPETSWSGADYSGRKSETGGILAILSMLVEDLEKEMGEGRADNADAQEKYLKQNGALQETLDSQEATKVSQEKEMGDLEEKIELYEKHKNAKTEDKAAEQDTKESIYTDCSWVKTHFDTRREKRKTEIQGLVDAKGFLAGVDSGDAPLPP